MEKEAFTKLMHQWLETFTKEKFSNENYIDVIIPGSNLNILSHEELSKVPNVGLMEFKPDVLGILTHKATKKTELIFLNRETKKFSLKELGEMLCYCRIAKPTLALMASLQGLSPAVDRMINHLKKRGVISFNGNNIVIFRWDEKLGNIDKYSITPIESRDIF